MRWVGLAACVMCACGEPRPVVVWPFDQWEAEARAAGRPALLLDVLEMAREGDELVVVLDPFDAGGEPVALAPDGFALRADGRWVEGAVTIEQAPVVPRVVMALAGDARAEARAAFERFGVSRFIDVPTTAEGPTLYATIREAVCAAPPGAVLVVVASGEDAGPSATRERRVETIVDTAMSPECLTRIHAVTVSGANETARVDLGICAVKSSGQVFDAPTMAELPAAIAAVGRVLQGTMRVRVKSEVELDQARFVDIGARAVDGRVGFMRKERARAFE